MAENTILRSLFILTKKPNYTIILVINKHNKRLFEGACYVLFQYVMGVKY